MDWEKVSVELQKPLNPDAIKPPPKGKFGEYVDALHVIREANRIFGHDGWSYEVTRLTQTHYAEIESRGKPQLRCSFLCSVKVTVDGTIREGTAVGVGNGKPENAGDVIESAVKEAETDALKRALRTFGNTFGLALYEKDKSKREVAHAPQEPTPADVRDYLRSGLQKQTTAEALENAWGHADFVKKFDALPEPMQNEVRAVYTEKRTKLDTGGGNTQ